MLVIRNNGDIDTDPVYRCPQITALQLIGTYPQIYFVPFDVWGKSFTITLVSWKQLHDAPVVFAAVLRKSRRVFSDSDDIGHLFLSPIARLRIARTPRRPWPETDSRDG